jgi:hypothetical protein
MPSKSKSKSKSKPGFKRRTSYIFSTPSVVPINSKADELSKFSKTTLKKKPTVSASSPGFFRNLMSRFTRRRDATIEPAMSITMTNNPLNGSKSKGGRKSRKFRYD